MAVNEHLLSLMAAITGYQRHRPFHTNHEKVVSPSSYAALDTPDAKQEQAHKLREHVIEEYQEFVIGHIEFDDQGAFWDRKQLETVQQRLGHADVRDNGALIVVFVHGWRHNADYRDTNLCDFREVLFDLYETELKLRQPLGLDTSRKIIGIYCSWRGLSNKIVPLSILSFWNRKETAHRVGSGSLLTALVWLEQVRMSDEMHKKQSKLVVVGHSFGGAAVFSAVSSYIKAVSVERLAEETLLGRPMPQKITGFGDGVVLVNPAFEALLYDDFDYLASNIKAYRNDQHVVLMIVGADNDRATGILFPIGQALKRIRERRQRGQFRKICTSVSNYAEFATHRLRPRDENAREGNRSVTEPAVSLSEWRMPDQQGTRANDWLRYVPASRGWSIESVRKELPYHHCFMVIESVEGLVDGHNGIFTKLFVEFLRDFLIGQDLALAFDAEMGGAT